MTEAAVKLSNIQTTTIGGGANKNAKTLLLNGTIRADERRSASQVLHIPGRIEQLFVASNGEKISKGQKLALIFSPELITAQREYLEAIKFKDVSPGLVEAARKKLRYWKITEAQINQIEKDKIIKETFTIFAESSGIVLQKRVSVGDYLKEGEILFDIINLNRLWVVFDAYEADLSNIRLGNKITFTTPALPNQTFTATINYIDPLIDPNTRTAAVRTEINNQSGRLKPEMFVKGTLVSKPNNAKKSALVVPKTAVLWTGKRSVVYVKVPDMDIPSFQYKVVELGEVIGTNYQIINGLKAGDEVVTNGAFSIDGAAQLNNQSSMMNQNVSIKKKAKIGTPDYIASTPTAFKKQLRQLVENYIGLKDAFVETDAEAAKTAVQSFNTALNNMDASLLAEEAQSYWLKNQKGMLRHSQKIASLNDVEKQRKRFQGISNLLIPSLKAFGIDGSPIYIQHCPMAFDYKGADWLSLEEPIKNPYFGDKMMRCGSVIGTIDLEELTESE
jgi:Cu(I)/Ag(I) efflux system membrane fusion protein